MRFRKLMLIVSGAAVIVAGARPASAYSVLAHEAAIDLAWESSIRPLLMRRYPSTTTDALDRARSFAYGGSVIQDLGYYPFGNKFFSNLVHYTRTGDFVEALLRDAGDVDELAFAIGALAHYANDNAGHPAAVNLAVPMIFPKLQAKYGDVVTYEQAPKQHVIVEFSFDVAHTARATYPLAAFRNLIGFRVATPLLERAFYETYGLEMSALFGSQDRAIATYRYAVSQVIPTLTQTAWREKQKEIEQATPTISRNAFVFVYRRADFEKDFGKDYQKPALFARFLGVLYRIVPKVGPLKPLSFTVPTPEADLLFGDSVRAAGTRFRASIAAFGAGRLNLTNTNFDTGQPSRRGDYAMADETYAELLERLSDDRFEGVTTSLQRHIVSFYGENPAASPVSRKDQKHWKQVSAALADLKTSVNPLAIAARTK